MKKSVCACGLFLMSAAWGFGADLVARYAFDDQENLGRDSSKNGNNLTVTQGFKAPVYSADGKVGGASYFDGSAGWVTPKGIYPEGAFTITAWVKPEDTDFAAIIEPTARRGGAAFFHAGGKYRFRTFKSDGSYVYRIGEASVPGEWVHLAITYSVNSGPDRRGDCSGTLRVYVNGEQVTGTAAGYAGPEEYAMQLGSYSANSIFKGWLDEVCVYRGDMSKSAIGKLVQDKK